MRRDVFQAIADPNRRSIIFLLAVRPMTPNDLASHFTISRQAVSKHLQILVDCEMVQPEPKGRLIFYHLIKDKLNEIQIWLESYHELISQNIDQSAQALKMSKDELKPNDDYLSSIPSNKASHPNALVSTNTLHEVELKSLHSLEGENRSN